jgi:oligopeptide/dipeptide ABC transporter ATP-binding protein
MIFQDPMAALNPRMTIGDLLTEGLVEHRMLKGETRDAAATRLLAEVGMGADALWKYPFEFSGGQRQRICIARALSLEPDLVVCDEVVSALDVSVQAQVINLLVELRKKRGLAYLMIGHDLSVLRHVSHRIAVMYLGRLAEIGPADSMVEAPKHPYAQALVAAVPVPGVKKARAALKGEPPSAAKPPPGCPFHPRCPKAMPICRIEFPARRTVDGHRVWCHLYEENGAEQLKVKG